MDPESKKFGRGPRELTGSVDLINRYKLLPHHEFFCKKSLPLSVADTHYLHNVVGDTEIRKGEGMQLDQLVESTSSSRETNGRIQPFDLEIPTEAFQLRETVLVDLPTSDKGAPTIAGKSRSESKDKEKKHKKHKDKYKEHKKHKHRHKDRNKDVDKDKKKDKSVHDSGREQLKKHHEKKRMHDGDEDINDIHRHKKSFSFIDRIFFSRLQAENGLAVFIFLSSSVAVEILEEPIHSNVKLFENHLWTD